MTDGQEKKRYCYGCQKEVPEWKFDPIAPDIYTPPLGKAKGYICIHCIEALQSEFCVDDRDYQEPSSETKLQ